ncbi:hypothetical protein Tco_0784912 [Tanacetum coccineum]
MYHNLKDDDIMKNIFNSGRYKDKVGMKIPAWMISEEMKHTKHYRMYAEVFEIDVPLTQSQPTESTQGTHRTPSAPRSPNPNMDTGVASAPKRSTVIRFRIPQRRSTCLTPPAPVPTVDKADVMILQDTLQHLASLEIEKMVEGPENVIDDSSIPRNDDQNILDTRLEPRSDKESSEVEITNDEEVEITNVVIPVNVNKEDEEITEVYELKRREKGKIVEESRSIPFPTPIRSPRIRTDLVSSDTEKLQKFTEVMVESLPTMVDKHIKEQVKTQIPEQVKVQVPERGKLQAEISLQIQKAIDTNIPSLVDASIRSYMSGYILHVPQTTCRTPVVRLRDQDDPHDVAHPEGEISAKWQKTSEVLEGLKNYNNDVKYGYIQRDLIEDEVEYLKLFEQEIKIVEQEVKGTASSSSSSNSQNKAFVSSPSSTNEVNTAYGVSTTNTQVSPASTQVSTASTHVSTANLSDDTVYTFLASQPNGSQLVYEDLKQIHEDDIEEMDLKWQLALLNMRTRRFFQKTGRKITINGSDTAGYDKSKVKCFNCHKMGYFAREYKGPRNQDSRNRNQDSYKSTINVEETSSKAMLAIDEAGFDWSYMEDDEIPTNMALMAFSDSEIHNDKTYSKTYLKNFETLKTQLDDLRIEFNN